MSRFVTRVSPLAQGVNATRMSTRVSKAQFSIVSFPKRHYPNHKNKEMGGHVAEQTYSLSGITVEDPFGVFSPKLHRAMAKDRYERLERIAVERCLKPDDRVLDLGAGCGVVGALAASIVGADAVTSVEANPALTDTIKHIHKINGYQDINLVTGLAGKGQGNATFYVSRDFWASSLSPDTPDIVSKEKIKKIDINDLVRDVKANVLVCDIEGAEFPLIDVLDLKPFDLIIMELHPTPTNIKKVGKLYQTMISAGLLPDLSTALRPSVAVFVRAKRFEA
ncbi:MAG: FkbM family methyltransferase [Pseudomonadota bacterium]